MPEDGTASDPGHLKRPKTRFCQPESLAFLYTSGRILNILTVTANSYHFQVASDRIRNEYFSQKAENVQLIYRDKRSIIKDKQ
jgi:hypothetical protein